MQARTTSGPSWPRSKFKRAALACRIAIDPAIAGAGGCTTARPFLLLFLVTKVKPPASNLKE